MTRRRTVRARGRHCAPSSRAAQRRRCPGKERLSHPQQPPWSRMCVDSLDTSADDRPGYSQKFSFAYRWSWLLESLSWLLGKFELDARQRDRELERRHFLG